jgi:predicted nucleotidyltransferase
VNKRPYYLGRVVAVVLFGSMLKPEVNRVSDADEIVPKEADRERARVKSYRRAGELERIGRRSRGLLGRDFCWYWEVFGFLRGTE